MAAPWGIWHSSDFRLSIWRNGRYEPHTLWSPKYVHVTCPDGAVILTYTGVGELAYTGRRTLNPSPGKPLEDNPAWVQEIGANDGRRLTGRATSEWLRSVLAGETRSVSQVIETLRTEASAMRAFRQPRSNTVF